VFFDPDTISFMTRAPDGTKTTYVWQTDSEVEIDAIGVYHLTFNVTQSGIWTVAAKGTDGDAVGQVTFEAQASVFG
jgi:hypothetical protein